MSPLPGTAERHGLLQHANKPQCSAAVGRHHLLRLRVLQRLALNRIPGTIKQHEHIETTSEGTPHAPKYTQLEEHQVCFDVIYYSGAYF